VGELLGVPVRVALGVFVALADAVAVAVPTGAAGPSWQ